MSAAPLSAASNIELGYGGRLTAPNGSPIQGPVELEVKFFCSATGTDLVPIAVPNFVNTPLVHGIFQIGINLPPADFHIVFDGRNEVWLQLRDVTHNVAYPRQKFAPVPYALKIPVDGKILTYSVDGELTLNATGAGPDKYLKIDANGDLVWSSVSGSGAGGDMFKADNLSD